MVKTVNIKPNSADKEAITKIVKMVRGGENLLIFPEGTRSRTGAMIEGKKGILLIARLTKAEIVPIGNDRNRKLLPIAKDGDMGGEKFNYADKYKNWEPISLPKKDKDEAKHEYDDRCMTYIMKSIANLLPEEYREFINRWFYEKRTKEILEILKEEYPDARCELNHETPFQLLVATICQPKLQIER